MEKNELINDVLWSLEMVEAQLSDDINFLHCISSEYLEYKEPKENLQYLYRQLKSMITTLTKSMEHNQEEARRKIDEYFTELKKRKIEGKIINE